MGYTGTAAERLAYVRARMEESMAAIRYKTGRHQEVERESLKNYRLLEKDLIEEARAEAAGDSMTSLGVYGGVE